MVHHEGPCVAPDRPRLLVAAPLALGIEALLGHAGLDGQCRLGLPDGTAQGVPGGFFRNPSGPANHMETLSSKNGSPMESHVLTQSLLKHTAVRVLQESMDVSKVNSRGH